MAKEKQGAFKIYFEIHRFFRALMTVMRTLLKKIHCERQMIF